MLTMQDAPSNRTFEVLKDFIRAYAELISAVL